MTRWRLFTALPVPTASASAIDGALASHRRAFPEARWLDPALYHVTLRFLGSVSPEVVPGVADAVSACADGAQRFAVRVARGGGSRGRSEVAWLDLVAGRDMVTALADRLDTLLPPDVLAGLPATRPVPHLTVARRAPRALADALGTGRLGEIGVSWTADRMTLFRSHTGTPSGSTYEPLAEARLGRRTGV